MQVTVDAVDMACFIQREVLGRHIPDPAGDIWHVPSGEPSAALPPAIVMKTDIEGSDMKVLSHLMLRGEAPACLCGVACGVACCGFACGQAMRHAFPLEDVGRRVLQHPGDIMKTDILVEGSDMEVLSHMMLRGEAPACLLACVALLVV